MPYVTSFERNAMLTAIRNLLDARFGDEGVALVPEIRQLNDADKYLALIRAIGTAASLEDARRAYEDVAAPPSASAGKKGRRTPRTKP